MNAPTRSQVLRLYRHILRYGSNLRLTDKQYFLGRVKSEFRKNQHLEEQQEIELHFKRGETLLKKARIV